MYNYIAWSWADVPLIICTRLYLCPETYKTWQTFQFQKCTIIFNFKQLIQQHILNAYYCNIIKIHVKKLNFDPVLIQRLCLNAVQFSSLSSWLRRHNTLFVLLSSRLPRYYAAVLISPAEQLGTGPLPQSLKNHPEKPVHRAVTEPGWPHPACLKEAGSGLQLQLSSSQLEGYLL